MMARRRKRQEKRHKKKKSKASITSTFKKTEYEVQLLLEEVNKSNSTHEVDSDTQSVNFFCKAIKSSRLTNIVVNDEGSDEAQEEEEEAEEDSQSENRTVESTYIQIEALEEPVVKPLPKQKHFTNMDVLLYQPSQYLNPYINLSMDSEQLSQTVVRLLNRYYEETHNVSTELIMALVESHNLQTSDKALYRSFCAKEFKPIFCSAQRQFLQIPTRQLLILHLKQLQFTDHPELLQEHRFANSCERVYAEYVAHKQQKICESLEMKLRQERAVMQELLQQASLENEQGQAVAKQMLLVRKLREELFAEELARKLLLQELMEKWLLLKKIRKSQKQQYSRFKLRINVKQVENINWKERYKTDLEEIYGEKLEEYYRKQRKWKKQKNKIENKPEKPKLKIIARELRQQYKELFEGPLIEIQRCDVGYNELDTIKQKVRSFFMKIYLDEQFVCSSSNYRLETDFTCHIDENFGVLLDRHIPKQVSIVLYEKFKLPAASKKLAKILIPLPGHVEKCLRNYVSYDFECKQQYPPIAGYLNARIYCELQENNTDKIENLVLDVAEQKTVTDEDEEHLVELDTCTFEEERLMFCSFDELKANRRFQLLCSRKLQNNARTKDLRFIPALEQEIVHEKVNLNDCMEPLLDIGDWMEPIDLQLHQGKKYIKCLFDAIRDQCACLSQFTKSAHSLLEGDEPGNWSAVFSAFINKFRPSSFLPSVFAENKPASLRISSDSYQRFTFIFNIVRATGIPIRSYPPAHIEEPLSQDRNLLRNFKYTNVSPFIAIMFKDKVCRTLTAEGSSPTWNEELVLHLSINESDLREELKIVLFDEVIESQVNDDVTMRNADIFQRIQTNWLGEYSMPISVLLQQSLEGVIELKTPQIIIGYNREAFSTDLPDGSILDSEAPKFKDAVYLWYHARVQPNAVLSKVQTDCLDCAELQEVRQQLTNWEIQVRELNSCCFIDPFICTNEGKRVCITRLLEPVPLPFDAKEEHLLDRLMRFVSQINVIKHYHGCLNFNGVWLNNKVLLDTTWGSAKDLGVLLCNFILASGRNACLVLGEALPYGNSAFVLIPNTTNLKDSELCDPYTGRRYGLGDIFCPLNKIYCIVAQDNIYCNIQSETRVHMTSFQLSDTSCWLPAFSKRNPGPIGGVQSLDYVFRDTMSVNEIRLNIERKIIKKISSWRTMRKTIWNRAFQSRLLNILEKQATWSNRNKNYENKYTQQLEAEFPAYKFFGFTLNFPYTNLTSISKHIKSTAIHLNNDRNVEFCLAVHLEVFSNNILSVWIFLMSLTPI